MTGGTSIQNTPKGIKSHIFMGIFGPENFEGLYVGLPHVLRFVGLGLANIE
jgi:hypothetical protein